MAGFEILFKESVWKDLRKIPKSQLKKMLSRIGKLKDNPRPIGCEKLTGQELYRVRQGKYRIVYSIKDNELTVWVIKVGHRSSVYRRSEQTAVVDAKQLRHSHCFYLGRNNCLGFAANNGSCTGDCRYS